MSPRIHPTQRRSAVSLDRAVRSSAVAVLVLVAVACGGSSQGTALAATAGSPSPSSGASGGPTRSLTFAPPSGSPETPEPSVDPHGVPKLEALLPTKVGTVDLEIRSLTGSDFYALGTPQTQAQLDTMLGNLDKAVTDLTIADAYDPTGRTVIEIGAFRVAGAKPDRLLGEWVAATQASRPGKISVSNATVDGRAVTKLVDSTVDVGGTTYAFAVDDTIFLVRAADADLSSEALGKLPKS